jgi:hypothetical protein
LESKGATFTDVGIKFGDDDSIAIDYAAVLETAKGTYATQQAMDNNWILDYVNSFNN